MGNIVSEINHCGLAVKNLEESVKFYQKVLGLEKDNVIEVTVDDEGAWKDAKMKVTFLKAGKDVFEILEYKHPKPKKCYSNPWDIGVQHLSFRVNDIRKIYKENKDKIEFLSPPIHYKDENIDTTWTYLRDPDGALIELSELK